MIRSIIFDLGNVLLPISHERCLQAFSRLASAPLPLSFFSDLAEDVFNKQEIGAISDEDFIERIRAYGNFKATDEDIVDAWLAILGEMPDSRFRLLEKLSAEGYRLYLLSNTNGMHQRQFEKDILRQSGRTLPSFFKTAYYSHLIGRRKPDKICFEFVLNDAGIDASETLFIDDMKENAAAASSLGIPTICLERFDDLEETLGIVLAK